jgi:nitrogenase molybdenum-iron protein NifN
VGSSNPCKLCAPLGASLAFKGIAGAVPLLHGSQGCATYIRRYLIGHFREPVDIASSSFSEATTIFGGGENLRTAIVNIVGQYHPALIGIATTCLAETIGEDIGMHIRQLDTINDLPPIVPVSCPSYAGTHIDGFRNAVKAIIDKFAQCVIPRHAVTLFPGMLSCAELRHLRLIVNLFDTGCIMVPDYSETLDGGIWDDYRLLPEGGTTIQELSATGSSEASIELGAGCLGKLSAGRVLETKCAVASYACYQPIGIDACDAFIGLLSRISGRDIPEDLQCARRRLIDQYVDGHKFVAGKRAAIYGDTDRVVALAGFLTEIGMRVTAVMSGEAEANLSAELSRVLPDAAADTLILGDADFGVLSQAVHSDPPDLLIGNSKGYPLARELGIPLVRTGFPVHDRIGGQRLMHVGYEGTQTLFENIANTLIERCQSDTGVGYMTW